MVWCRSRTPHRMGSSRWSQRRHRDRGAVERRSHCSAARRDWQASRLRVHVQAPTAGEREHEGVEERVAPGRHRALPLAWSSACMGNLARHGGHNAGGATGAWRVEIRGDGQALCPLRAGANAESGWPTCYVLVYSNQTGCGWNAATCWLIGRPCRDRTCDQRIKRIKLFLGGYSNQSLATHAKFQEKLHAG